MHHSVVRFQVGNRDLCIVDEDAISSDAHRYVAALQCLNQLTIGQVGSEGFSAHNVVLENVREVGQRQQVIGCDFKRFRQRDDGCISWGKDRERTLTAQRVNQARCSNSCFEQRVVFAVDNDVHNRGFLLELGHQYSIDYMHHTVIGGKVRDNDLSVVNEDTVRSDAHRYVFSEQGLNLLTIRQIRRVGLSTDNVVLENVHEVWQCQQLICSDIKRFCQRDDGIVGWGEYRERTFCAQCINQTGCAYGRFEQRVIFAVHDDIHNRVGRWCGIDRHGRDHSVSGVRADGAVVIVHPFNREGVGADANTVHVAGYSPE